MVLAFAVVDGAKTVVCPIGLSHSVEGGSNGGGSGLVFALSVVAEPGLPEGGSKGGQQSDSSPVVEAVEEEVVSEFQGGEVGTEPAPVASLLGVGTFDDCVEGGSCCSQEVTLETSECGSGQI